MKDVFFFSVLFIDSYKYRTKRGSLSLTTFIKPYILKITLLSFGTFLLLYIQLEYNISARTVVEISSKIKRIC